MTALLGAFTAAGCSYQLDSLFSKADTDVEQTGSTVRSADQAGHAATAAPPSEVDLAYARAVAADVLAHAAKDSSIPWENPHTGAGGNITPLAASYSEGAFTCRDFLASYVRGRIGGLAARRGLPHARGQVGGEKPKTSQAGLIGSSSHSRHR